MNNLKKGFFFSIFLLLLSCEAGKVESVEITYPKLSALSLSLDEPLLLPLGETVSVVAIVNATEGFFYEIEWKSANDSIIFVSVDKDDSKKAVLQAKGLGTCSITATAGKKKNTITIEVVEPKAEKEMR